MASIHLRIATFLMLCALFSVMSFRKMPRSDGQRHSQARSLDPGPRSPLLFDRPQQPMRLLDGVPPRRIVVTGGAGTIGTHLVQRLLLSQFAVTVIDLLPNPVTSPAPSLIRWIQSDVRNASAVSLALTPDVVGIVHLAAVSRVLRCGERAEECMELSIRGVQALLDVIDRKPAGFQPWIVLASSREVYGRNESHRAEDKPSTAYGLSHLAAEHMVHQMIDGMARTGKRRIHAISLRLATVYGSLYDHHDRLVLSFIKRSLAHQPLQVYGPRQQIDLVHIEDCTDAFVLAASHLDKTVSRKRFWGNPLLFDVADVSGARVTLQELVDKIAVVTQSKSAVQTLPRDARYPALYLDSPVPGLADYQPRVALDTGILRFVRQQLEETQKYLTQKTRADCDLISHPYIAANEDLHKLDGCTANLLVDVKTEVWSLAFDYNPRHAEDPDNMGPGTIDDYGLVWVLSENIIPDPVKLSVQIRKNRVFLKVAAVRTYARHFLGLYSSSLPEFASGFVFDHVHPRDDGSDKAVVEWELIFHPIDGSFKLVLPDSGFQVLPPSSFAGWFSWISDDIDTYPFRLSPICCPAPPPWPFYYQDPIQYSIHLERYSKERSFNQTIPQTLCERAKAALDQTHVTMRHIDALDGTIPNKPRRMGRPSEWAHKSLVACSNDCAHPTVCVYTGNCSCVQAMHCTLQDRFSAAPTVSHSLLDLVDKTSWQDVLRPEAARYLESNGSSWPVVHIAAVDRVSESLRGPHLESVARLLERDCFSADASMELALRVNNVARVEDAEVIFQPYYHARMWTDEGAMETLMEQLDANYPNRLQQQQVVLPSTYDWGLCLFFTWTIWEVRQKYSVPDVLKDVVAWSVMGDLNSPCYRPHQDIIIPPRSCRTRQLRPAFSNPAFIRPATHRTLLSFFHGTIWGSGGTLRRKLTCQRPLPGDGLTAFERSRAEMGLSFPLPTMKWEKPRGHREYMSILNNTIFCAVPAGVAGWAPRIEDAIYAGCIPVIFDDDTHLPFWELLDWSMFSVRVYTEQVQELESILMGYSMQQILRMQANLIHVRDILTYPLDQRHADMVTARSPLSFALHQTRLKLATRWPTAT